MRVLLVDSRDSFTFNLAHAFEELGAKVDVAAGHALTPAQARDHPADLVCVGPGPRGPAELPALVELISALDGERPLFGVCLGMQALVRARGGEVGRARAPVHGKTSPIEHDGRGVFAGLPSPLEVMRYHSLVATRVPDSLVVCARDRDGQPMAVRDPERATAAVQFHPESLRCEGGLDVLAGALALAGGPRPAPRYRSGSIRAPGSL